MPQNSATLRPQDEAQAREDWSRYVKLPPIRHERHFENCVVRCFAERPGSVDALLRRSVAAKPDGEALVCGARRLSYRQLDELVDRVAAGLAKRGVGKGERVALLLSNSVEFVVLVYAVARLGAICVPLNVREQRPEVGHVLTDCRPRVVLFERQFEQNVPQDAIEVAFVPLDLADADPLAGLKDAAAPPVVETHEEEVATLLYTSGTTGKPKGALLTHMNIIHSVLHYQVAMELTADDRSIIPVPMSHVTGLVALVHVVIGAGAALVVMPTFQAAAFIDLAARERMTHTILVPAMFNLCLLQPTLDDADLSAWRISAYGGAIMPQTTVEQIGKRLPRLKLMNCYGATETTSPATMMPPPHAIDRRDSVGLPAPCAEILVMDEDGREVAPGTDGEIWIGGPMVVKGYWENPEATAREFVGGFWRSGDLGNKDAAGFVRVVDRLKDVINRGGYKIHASELENLILKHEALLEAAVIPVPCPVLGERVHAVVVLKEEAVAMEQGALAELLRGQVADYKVPETWSIRREPLPRNANGKVLKRVLRDERAKEG